MIDLALWILAGAAFLFLLSACWRVVLERSKLRCYAGLLLLSDDFREPQKAIFENWITGTRPIDTGALLAIQSRANRLVLPSAAISLQSAVYERRSAPASLLSWSRSEQVAGLRICFCSDSSATGRSSLRFCSPKTHTYLSNHSIAAFIAIPRPGSE